MSRFNFLVLLLTCAILIDSTMGRLRHSRISDDSADASSSQQQLEEIKRIASMSHDVLDSLNVLDRISTTASRRELQAAAVADYMYENAAPFIFSYDPSHPGPSCKEGDKADELRQQYKSNLAAWKVSQPSCYTFIYEPVCFKCADEPVQVTVVEGVVTSPTVNNAEAEDDIPTMEGLFEQLRDCAYDCSKGYIHQCKVQFDKDQASGAPFIAGLLTDEEEELVDDEIAYYVRGFQTC